MNFELLRKGRTNDWLDDDKPSTTVGNKATSPAKQDKNKENEEDDLKKEIEELRAQISALQKSKGITETSPTKKTPKKTTKKKQRPKSMNFALNADGEIQPTGESVEDIAKKLKQEKTVISSSEKKSPKPTKTIVSSTKKTKSPSDSRKDTAKDSEKVASPVKESVQSPAKEIRKSEKDQSATPAKEISPKPTKSIASSSKKKHVRPKSMDFVLKDENNEKKEKSPKKIKKEII